LSVEQMARAHAAALATRDSLLLEPTTGEARRVRLDKANNVVWGAERTLADAIGHDAGVLPAPGETWWLVCIGRAALRAVAAGPEGPDLVER
jgi:hypothetical protein